MRIARKRQRRRGKCFATNALLAMRNRLILNLRMDGEDVSV
jgi:hypothetical protein